jgi:hypothetical protein
MPQRIELHDEIAKDVLLHFSILRAEAIADYSDLEQTYCECLASFQSMSARTAATLLFQINKRPSRSLVLSKVIMEKIDNIHANYWRDAIDFARALDERHSQIVHWSVTAANCENSQGKYPLDVFLTPPNYWTSRSDTEGKNKLFGPDLEIFSEQCKFLARSLSAFFAFYAGGMTPQERDAWRETFTKPLVFPPPPDHPLTHTL